MRTTLHAIVIVFLAACMGASASMVLPLSEEQSGNYWYERETWTGGSWTDNGFSYGDSGTGLIHSQRFYYFYQGADRSWETKAIYFQIDLGPLADVEVESAVFNFYIEAYNSSDPTALKHLETQTTPATGDASEMLAGNIEIVSSDTFVAGWNAVDITSQIQSDLDKGYAYTALSIPEFAQEYNTNRYLSIYGASTDSVIGGQSLKPYLVVIPEPSTLLLLTAGSFAALSRRRRNRNR